MDNKVEICPFAEMHRLNVSLCDPFGLISEKPSVAASELNLAWDGRFKFSGRDAIRLTSWDADARTRWFIDSSSGLPESTEQCSKYGVFRTRFFYHSVNQPIAASEFAVPKIQGALPTPSEPLDAGYTNRFVNL